MSIGDSDIGPNNVENKMDQEDDDNMIEHTDESIQESKVKGSHQGSATTTSTRNIQKPENRKRTVQFRKAPQAPKKAKSAFILFSQYMHRKIKTEHDPDVADEKVPQIAKRVSAAWKTLLPEERAHWEEKAGKDKMRYDVEKAMYSGPWKTPSGGKRAKKDPEAPKRPMSAFLDYSKTFRSQVSRDNSQVKDNKEISRILGDMWRNATEEERKPFVEKERRQRAEYNETIKLWRKERDDQLAEERRQREAAVHEAIENGTVQSLIEKNTFPEESGGKEGPSMGEPYLSRYQQNSYASTARRHFNSGDHGLHAAPYHDTSSTDAYHATVAEDRACWNEAASAGPHYTSTHHWTGGDPYQLAPQNGYSYFQDFVPSYNAAIDTTNFAIYSPVSKHQEGMFPSRDCPQDSVYRSRHNDFERTAHSYLPGGYNAPSTGTRHYPHAQVLDGSNASSSITRNAVHSFYPTSHEDIQPDSQPTNSGYAFHSLHTSHYDFHSNYSSNAPGLAHDRDQPSSFQTENERQGY